MHRAQNALTVAQGYVLVNPTGPTFAAEPHSNPQEGEQEWRGTMSFRRAYLWMSERDARKYLFSVVARGDIDANFAASFEVWKVQATPIEEGR